MIRILNRDYGNNARIVGIADGSGVGEDPDGLDHTELLRLFKEALPIAKFDPKKLGKHGAVVPVEAPGGVMIRNTLHNRLKADAFIPGGGRPATINESNWRDYLTEEGKPSAPIIVVSKPFLPWFNTSRLMAMMWNSWAIVRAACVTTRMLLTWCPAPLLMARRTAAF